MKVIDTREYVSVLKQLTDDGREASMRIAGNSMAPFLIHERDTIFFRKPEAKLKKGDMVFFKRRNGQYIMHRIHHVKPDGYYIVGDAQCMIEGPVAGEQIFAVVTKVIRKGKTIQPGDFWWEFFRHVWLHMVLVRRPVMALYTKLLFRGGRS